MGELSVTKPRLGSADGPSLCMLDALHRYSTQPVGSGSASADLRWLVTA